MPIATEYVSARVEPDLAESFRLAAELDRISLSQALRTAMRHYVQRVAQNDGERAPVSENAPAAGSKHAAVQPSARPA